MNGDITVKGQTSDVDLSFSDFLEDLIFAAEVHFEATRKKDRRKSLDSTQVRFVLERGNLVLKGQEFTTSLLAHEFVICVT